MKKFVIAAAVVASMSAPAFAGSLDAAEDEYEPVANMVAAPGSIGWVPLVGGAAAVLLLASALDSSDGTTATGGTK